MYFLDYMCGCKHGKVVGHYMILVFFNETNHIRININVMKIYIFNFNGQYKDVI
jgi:hypothetical protein